MHHTEKTVSEMSERGMAVNEQCNDCIHRDVCAYKRHYEDVINMYKQARKEAGKYPWFCLDITCVKYLKERSE